MYLTVEEEELVYLTGEEDELTLQAVLSLPRSFLMAFFCISFSFLASWATCLASSSSFSFRRRAASNSACRA